MLPSPSLLFFKEAIQTNIDKVLDMADSASRLWPHIKTHKTLELVALLQKSGINRYKCSTIAEAELLGICGVAETVLAYPLVGPNIARFLELCAAFPSTTFIAIADDSGMLCELDRMAAQRKLTVNVMVDVNVGMNRTGVPVGPALHGLYQELDGSRSLRPAGLHVYDGHNHNRSPEDRNAAADACYESVSGARRFLAARGMSVPRVIMGGTPTLPCHSRHSDVDLSPGTAFLYDWGYGTQFPDLPFKPAAVLMTRVVSRPSPDLFTLDLGSKAIASDPEGARGIVAGLPEARPVFQNEEHWVFSLEGPAYPRPGDVMYVVPTHVCPSVSLHAEVYVIDGAGNHSETWSVAARNRKISI